MINVGIISLGFMGLTHYRSYQQIPGAKVIAIADSDPRRTRGDLTGMWGNIGPAAQATLPMEDIRGMTDYRELLAMPEVDVVDVCVPTTLHPQIAIEALNSGKHVLCEKPLALTSAEAQRIADAAASAKGLFMPAQCIRFWPQWAWAKRAIEENTYGKVLGATFQRVCSIPAGDWYKIGEKSGGAILDLHIHDTDFVCYLFGKPNVVSSRGYAGPSGKIDHVMTQYLYDDVPLVNAEGGWAFSEGFGFAMRYRINFERATVEYDSGRADPLMLYIAGNAKPIDCGGSDGYVEELKYFIQCIEKNTPPSIVTAEDAVRSIRVIEAERQSVESGTPMPVR